MQAVMRSQTNSMDENVLVEEVGQKISFAKAYHYGGEVLRGLCLYDYMSLVKLKRKSSSRLAWGEVPFDTGWSFSRG